MYVNSSFARFPASTDPQFRRARVKQTARKTTTGGILARKGFAAIKKLTQATKEKKPHRFRPGTVALREIKRYQKSNELLVKKMPFQRLVREVASKLNPKLRFEASAVLSLQAAAEAYLTSVMSDANLCATHNNRVTVTGTDMGLAVRFRGTPRL